MIKVSTPRGSNFKNCFKQAFYENDSLLFLQSTISAGLLIVFHHVHLEYDASVVSLKVVANPRD